MLCTRCVCQMYMHPQAVRLCVHIHARAKDGDACMSVRCTEYMAHSIRSIVVYKPGVQEILYNN